MEGGQASWGERLARNPGWPDTVPVAVVITALWSLTFPPCWVCMEGFFVLPWEGGREAGFPPP